jgi:hypothetical protein
MSNLKGRLEKMEVAHLGSRRRVNIWKDPDETQEQALANYHAKHPDMPLPPDADILFITWLAPDSGKGRLA